MNETTDQWVGRLLAETGATWNVVIVSDHGMTASVPRVSEDRLSPHGDHHPSGLLLMAGPDILPNTYLRGASVYDIFPTVLHLLGLPVPDGLPGRVLAEALNAAKREAPIQRIVNFGERPEGDTAPIQTSADDDYREKLKALGYIVD
jgi:arylsulfatase A-like enzyme